MIASSVSNCVRARALSFDFVLFEHWLAITGPNKGIFVMVTFSNAKALRSCHLSLLFIDTKLLAKCCSVLGPTSTIQTSSRLEPFTSSSLLSGSRRSISSAHDVPSIWTVGFGSLGETHVTWWGMPIALMSSCRVFICACSS